MAIQRMTAARCNPHILARKNGRALVGLSREERRKTAMVQYYLRGKFVTDGSAVVLVDDVLTSGATLTACAQLLKNNGQVTGLTLAFEPD